MDFGGRNPIWNSSAKIRHRRTFIGIVSFLWRLDSRISDKRIDLSKAF
jgi:hypothetical protein